MATQGRLRYDEASDSFVYEIRKDGNEWGMCMACKCVRREGAEAGEGTNYVHFDLLKKIVFDAQVYGVSLRLAWEGEQDDWLSD